MMLNKKRSAGVGLLGIASAFVGQAQADNMDANQISLAQLENTRISQVEVDTVVGNTCYGLPCPDPEPQPEDNCADAVIESNLQKLRRLNIVKADELSPFSCTGYCFSDTPEGRQADKCEKADALAELVRLAEPLRVPPGN